MSPIAIISDIHANLPALRAVLAAIDAASIGTVVSIGDVAGYGPNLDECVALLAERGIPNLMGNHDNYLVKGIPCPRSTSANLALDYQRETAMPDTMAWLRRSGSGFQFDDVSLVHGGWNDPVDEYLLHLNPNYFAERAGRLFVSGHTHVQGVWPLGQKLYANPGSVGQPRDGDPRAAFAVLRNGEFELHRVAYDIDAYAAACRRAGFPARNFECAYAGTRIGGGITRVIVDV